MDTPTKHEAWLAVRKIKALESALETIAEYWPEVRYASLCDAFSCTAYELRRRLRELEQADMRTIADRIREQYEG